MRSFFQNLEKAGVRYLLISGQASVLYGAAQFSEDIDLWLSPTDASLQAFLHVLKLANASVYKLTPPLNRFYLLRGHGFHFKLPEDRFVPAYLDLMGRPPRVQSFASAFRKAQWILCDWGKIPVVSIPDLVELKKTRRAADYDVISNLVKIYLNSQKKRSSRLLLWCLNNVFRLEEALWIFKTYPQSRSLVRQTNRRWLKLLSNARELDIALYSRAQSLLSREIAQHQTADIKYWSSIIQELRDLRKQGKLVAEGTPVSEILSEESQRFSKSDRKIKE
jgi:hypothetical protein